ncbi:MAG: hypothetical protein ACR5LB_06780 [Wolbachia sp.]
MNLFIIIAPFFKKINQFSFITVSKLFFSFYILDKLNKFIITYNTIGFWYLLTIFTFECIDGVNNAIEVGIVAIVNA